MEDNLNFSQSNAKIENKIINVVENVENEYDRDRQKSSHSFGKPSYSAVIGDTLLSNSIPAARAFSPAKIISPAIKSGARFEEIPNLLDGFRLVFILI